MNHPADDTHAKLLIRDGFLWEAIDDGCSITAIRARCSR